MLSIWKELRYCHSITINNNNTSQKNNPREISPHTQQFILYAKDTNYSKTWTTMQKIGHIKIKTIWQIVDLNRWTIILLFELLSHIQTITLGQLTHPHKKPHRTSLFLVFLTVKQHFSIVFLRNFYHLAIRTCFETVPSKFSFFVLILHTDSIVFHSLYLSFSVALSLILISNRLVVFPYPYRLRIAFFYSIFLLDFFSRFFIYWWYQT